MWIPSVAALVAGVESLSHFDQTSARLAGSNGALTQLKNLKLWCGLPFAPRSLSPTLVLCQTVSFLRQESDCTAVACLVSRCVTGTDTRAFRWQSLSRTQQSLPLNKAQLVEIAEDAIESDLSAWTQGMLRKKQKVDGAEEETEGETGTQQKQQQQQQQQKQP